MKRLELSFADALQFVLRVEGGFYPGDKPADPNPTMYGITERVYHVWRRRNDMPPRLVKDISEDELWLIFYSWYWQPIWGAKLPHRLAVALFDMAVNSGPRAAVGTLQGVVGTATDGIMGPKTLAAVLAANQATLAEDFLWARVAFYRKTVQANIVKLPVLPGWLARLEQLREHIA